MDLDTILTNTATDTVSFGGQDMTIKFRPLLMTQERGEDIKTDDDVIQFVLEALISWDLKRGGRKMPVNEKSMRSIPFRLVAEIYNTIAFSRVEIDPEA